MPMENQEMTVRSIGLHWLYDQLIYIFDEMDGAIQEKDIEHIHRMRVASRRARAIFRIFEDDFPIKKRKIWKKQLRNLTTALGNARDIDVQIEFLDEFIPHTPKNACQGIKRIRLRLMQQRKEIQFEVIKGLNQFNKTNIRESISKYLINETEKVQSDTFPEKIFIKAEKSIRLAIGDTMRWQEYVNNPENITELHATRIAIKWLRYTIETFSPLYTGKMRNVVTVLKELQDTLGIIHDCDVWENHLETFIGEEKKQTITFYGSEQPFQFLLPGIEYLRDNRRTERIHQYQIFIDTWNRLIIENFWQSIRDSIIPAEHIQ